MAKDSRLYAEISIEIDEHPKIIGLSDAAFRAFFEALFYSRRMTNDGVIDERVVLKRWGQKVADELSNNDPDLPSWVRVDRGWEIHDFLEHNPSRAEIEEKRADLRIKRSEAGSKGAANRWHPDGKTIANDGKEKRREDNSSSTKKRGARKPETSLPDDWEPKPSHVAYATTRGVNGPHEEAQFRAHAAANDRRQRDWDAAFRMWLGNAKVPVVGRRSKEDQLVDVLEQGRMLMEQDTRKALE